MDLPKNITQIGEADEHCKIFVEDYVVSYLKQLNPLARDKTMAAALYGKRKQEEDVTFLFVYGAGKLDFIQKEVRHLSQAQGQEIERIRRQFFPEFEFLGYRILDGNVVEGFHVCGKEECRFVKGYAQFYEKNEAMLSYMLESRQVEAAPESVDSEKYDAARNRQEKRREKYARKAEEKGEDQTPSKAGIGGLRASAVAVLVLLCALGLAMNSPALKEKGFTWERLKEELREKKLPEMTVTSGKIAQANASRGEEKLQESLAASAESGEAEKEDEGAKTAAQDGKADQSSQGSEAGHASQERKADGQAGQENAAKQGSTTSGQAGQAEGEKGKTRSDNNDGDQTVAVPTAGKVQAESAEAGKVQTGQAEMAEAGKVQTGQAEMAEAEKVQTGQAAAAETDAPAAKEVVTYVVKRGDTLTGISLRVYGSEKYVDLICRLNAIRNPDEIKEGQKILLP